jgi:hypothetical protein
MKQNRAFSMQRRTFLIDQNVSLNLKALSHHLTGGNEYKPLKLAFKIAYSLADI